MLKAAQHTGVRGARLMHEGKAVTRWLANSFIESTPLIFHIFSPRQLFLET